MSVENSLCPDCLETPGLKSGAELCPTCGGTPSKAERELVAKAEAEKASVKSKSQEKREAIQAARKAAKDADKPKDEPKDGEPSKDAPVLDADPAK